MMARRQATGGVAAALLAMTAMCAAAQSPQTGAVPQTGAAQQGSGSTGTGTPGAGAPATGAQGAGSQGAQQMPGSSAQQGPVTATTGPDRSGPAHLEQKPSTPEKNKLAPANGDLTFLPELKPTDGVVNLAPEKSGDAQIASDADAMHEKPLLLDQAVAVINGDVILASDVREQQRFAVFEPLSAPGGEFTPMEAMQQIVNRTLLLGQMQEQELAPPPADRAVDEQIDELRKHIPACAGQSCETEEGWRRFLAARGFTEADLHTRWRERMRILDFVGVRFRTGIRITKPEIETYYKEKLLPEFQARKVTPPPLEHVSNRIDEVLLQQHVNVLLNDYLRSLKDAGSVQILDPQYNSLGNAPASTPTPGGADLTRPGRSGGEQ
jgi:peptidyl-prolyl cis-trans isomerase SurA